MPGLVAFGRRWEVASDDLVIPSIVESFVRLIWYSLCFKTLCVCAGVSYPFFHFAGFLLQLEFGLIMPIIWIVMMAMFCKCTWVV